jgi:hypothetical protein
MKSFKEYLTESKKTYEFKIKVVGDLADGFSKSLKDSLSHFKVESCSSGKRTPIQASHMDFPEHRNVNVTVFDVVVCYPATNLQVQSAIAEGAKLSASCVNVRNLKEEEEIAINHEHDVKSGKALLGTDYEDCDNQDKVGSEHSMSMLKELGTIKHAGTPYTGVNDELLAKSAPVEKTVAVKAPKIKAVSVMPASSKKLTPVKGK